MFHVHAPYHTLSVKFPTSGPWQGQIQVLSFPNMPGSRHGRVFSNPYIAHCSSSGAGKQISQVTSLRMQSTTSSGNSLAHPLKSKAAEQQAN